MDTLNVLITGAGAPGTRGTLYSLRKNWDNRNVFAVGVDMKTDVAGRYLCNRFHQVPSGTDADFIPALSDICEKERIDVVLPQVTNELFPLAESKRRFEEIGTKVAVTDFHAITLANNKYELLKIAKRVGVACPKSCLVKNWRELETAVEKIGFPVVVKPPIASGMRGLRIVHRHIDRKAAFYREKPDSSVTTIEELRNILGEEFPELLVMEFLPGKEYSVDILSSKERICVVVPRRRDLIRTGITFSGTVEKREDIVESSKKIVGEIGLEFACGLQFKEDNIDAPRIIEANPRIQGTMVLSTLAGANIVYGAVKLALGELDIPEFEIRWGTRLFRYWGGVGVDGELVEI